METTRRLARLLGWSGSGSLARIWAIECLQFRGGLNVESASRWAGVGPGLWICESWLCHPISPLTTTKKDDAPCPPAKYQRKPARAAPRPQRRSRSPRAGRLRRPSSSTRPSAMSRSTPSGGCSKSGKTRCWLPTGKTWTYVGLLCPHFSLFLPLSPSSPSAPSLPPSSASLLAPYCTAGRPVRRLTVDGQRAAPRCINLDMAQRSQADIPSSQNLPTRDCREEEGRSATFNSAL